MMPADYPAPVWARFQSAAFGGLAGREAEGAWRGEADNRAAGLWLRLWAWPAAGGGIATARFQALGCPTTLAVADWLAEALQGAEIAMLPRLDAARIMAALEIPESHRHCALVGEDALRALQAAVLDGVPESS